MPIKTEMCDILNQFHREEISIRKVVELVNKKNYEMKTIYKYPVIGVMGPIEMPKGAKILRAGFQNGRLFTWALVDIHVVETETRCFKIVATGGVIQTSEIKQFIGTVFENDAEYVWHIFEINI